ncbi:MAG: hypothetical protein HKN94_07460 [Acidimicrobiales bacterium]|nr:hypothetical protein [Acidimicrobiales bacterium]RZV47082.1 MAG: hypothetical protein EX269_05620 [Acidimicrobiales bacterium]
MTIKKGEEWGTVGTLPQGSPIASSNRDLFELINTGGSLDGPIGLTGGDLARTTGATASGADLYGEGRPLLPIDIGTVALDDEDRFFAAHVVIRSRWWSGPVTAVLNVSFVGEWNVAPRSHPNDGRLDLVEATLGWGDKIKARSRLRSGTHVPHPGISIRRVRTATVDVPPGHGVWVDGVAQPGVRRVVCGIRADAATIVI